MNRILSRRVITVGIWVTIISKFLGFNSINESKLLHSLQVFQPIRALPEIGTQTVKGVIKQEDKKSRKRHKKWIKKQLRKALFGKDWQERSQGKLVLNLFSHFFIMTIAFFLAMFGIRFLSYLPLVLFFFSCYYFGLGVNRLGDFYDLSDPLNNLFWTIISLSLALALYLSMRNRDQALAFNIGICLSIVIVCILGLYVFRLDGKFVVFNTILVSGLMATGFVTLGLKTLDNLLMVGSAIIGSLIFITNLQIALDDQSLITMKDVGLVYFIESPLLYFMSVIMMTTTGFLVQKWQERKFLNKMENSIDEIRNNVSLDLK